MKDKEKCRILVISDTHGRNSSLLKDLLIKEAPFDMLIHCGDVESDIFSYTGSNSSYAVYAVDGNCDYNRYPKELLIEAAGHRIFVTHGHNYNVRYSNDKLYAAARARQADVVLFGHTHVPEVEEKNGIFLMNPGSLGYPRGIHKTPSYGILELEKGKYPRTYLYETE